MPLDPPALSTPTTDPDLSSPPPSPPSPSALPDLHCEAVWRQTFLAQVTDAAERDAIQRFESLLYTATLSAGYVGNRDRLVAADELEVVALRDRCAGERLRVPLGGLR